MELKDRDTVDFDSVCVIIGGVRSASRSGMVSCAGRAAR